MKAYRLRIVLRHVKPEVFRVVLVPAGGETSLKRVCPHRL